MAPNTAIVPALPGCIRKGDMRGEALANIPEAILLYGEAVDDDAVPGPDLPDMLAIGIEIGQTVYKARG